MSLDRVLQPLVACLGNPVGGNPTQFVMTRIARDAELDWRFFTSQVEPDLFETALRGVQAMGMAGAAILEPFQQHATRLVDQLTPAARISGRVSVAKCDGQKWIGENTFGQAVVSLLASRFAGQGLDSDVAFAAQAIAVLGSAQTARAVHEALVSIPGDYRIIHCVESDREAEKQRVAQIGDVPGIMNPKEVVALDCRSLEKLSDLDRPLRALVVEDPSSMILKSHSGLRTKAIREIPWAVRPFCLFTKSHSCPTNQLEKLKQAFRDELQGRELDTADEMDLMVHQTAVDFHFWTSYEPDLELIRESLEEYLQW
jgi:shikimate dehydrogenase